MKAGTPFTHFDVHAEEGGEYSTYKLPDMLWEHIKLLFATIFVGNFACFFLSCYQ